MLGYWFETIFLKKTKSKAKFLVAFIFGTKHETLLNHYIELKVFHTSEELPNTRT
jgi:hypothetical protein